MFASAAPVANLHTTGPVVGSHLIIAVYRDQDFEILVRLVLQRGQRFSDVIGAPVDRNALGHRPAADQDGGVPLYTSAR